MCAGRSDKKKIDIRVGTVRVCVCVCVREKKCACMSLASGSVRYPASHFTAYVDLLCSVNRLVRGSIVPPANTAAELLTPVLLKSQIPSAIIPAHPAPLTERAGVLDRSMPYLTFLMNMFLSMSYNFR